jgi:hypothetical protein
MSVRKMSISAARSTRLTIERIEIPRMKELVDRSLQILA